MSRRIGDFFVYGIFVSGILVMTANKNGANLVSSVGNVLTGFTGVITGRNVSGAGIKVSGKIA